MARMNQSPAIFRAAAVFLALLCAAAYRAPAADAKSEPPVPVLRVDVLMIAMPEEKYIALRPDLFDKEKIEKTVPLLLDAVKRKEMILEGFPVILTKSGQRAVSETTREFRDDSLPYPYPFSTPMDFETRNLGVTLEVEPLVSPDGKSITLNLSPQRVDMLATPGGADEKKKEDTATKDEQPPDALKIYTMKVTTSVRLASGQHLLIAAHKMRQPEGYVEIFIVHAEIVPPDE